MRTLEDEIEILEMCLPLYNDAGGIWFRNNHNMADGNFKDWGAARAFARAATELPKLVKEIEQLRAERDHWLALVPRADVAQFPFTPALPRSDRNGSE